MDLEAGSVLGPYRVVSRLGRGGMASVYRAFDPSLDRHVALKVLPAEFLHDPAFAERFKQEARVAARLEHPHIVPIHAHGIEGGHPWMAMRLVTGGSLAERVRRGPLSPAETAAVLGDVAGALDYAHARGVVHRDVKPANVLLDEGGRAYLADFGIAKMLEGSSVATATGLIQGTPSYMAPEQAMGGRVDRLADVYALGVVAFECLTGRVPYTGTTPVAILMKHVQEPVPEPTEAEVARALSDVVRRCLAKTPADRWPSAGAFAAALAAVSSGVGAPAREDLPTLDVPTAGPTTPGAGTPAPRAARRGRRVLLGAAAGGLGALVAAAVGGAVLVSRLLAPPGVSPPPSSSATPVPSPAVTRGRATSVPTARPTPLPTTRTPPTTRPSPAAAATPSPRAVPVPVVADRGGAEAAGRIRVYCEAKLEPALFRKTGQKDVADSLKDLEEAIAKRGRLALAASRDGADAVVQVLERGREPAVVGMRKVRVRIVVGRESVELAGQDSMTGFNTWSGAANGAAKQVESWLEGRFAARSRE